MLPLITLPYLTRILGPENYGLIIYSWSFIQYFLSLTDYGFNLTATRRISINRGDLSTVREIFSAITYIRTGLMFISFIILLFMVMFIPSMQTHWGLYFVSFVAVLGNVLFPVWLFQGLEEMKYITIFNVLAKLVTTGLILLLVHSPSDYMIAAFVQSLGYVIPGLVSVYITLTRFNMRFVKVAFAMIREFFVEGFYVFTSGAAILSYTTYNVLVIGYVQGPQAVALFSIPNRITQLAVAATQPILQAFSPQLSHDYNCSFTLGRRKAYRLTLYIVALYIVGTVILFFLAGPIVGMIAGQHYEAAAAYLKIFSFVPPVTAIAYMVINVLMLNENLIKYSMYCYVAVALINVTTNHFVLTHFALSGMAIQYVLIEVVMTLIALHFYLSRRVKNETQRVGAEL